MRENRTPGSVRGASGNRRPYRDNFAGGFLKGWRQRVFLYDVRREGKGETPTA